MRFEETCRDTPLRFTLRLTRLAEVARCPIEEGRVAAFWGPPSMVSVPVDGADA